MSVIYICVCVSANYEYFGLFRRGSIVKLRCVRLANNGRQNDLAHSMVIVDISISASSRHGTFIWYMVPPISRPTDNTTQNNTLHVSASVCVCVEVAYMDRRVLGSEAKKAERSRGPNPAFFIQQNTTKWL